MTAKEVFRGLGLWICKTVFVMLLIGSVMFYAVGQITDSAFLKPAIGQILVSQASNLPLDEQYNGLIQICNVEQKDLVSVPLDTGEKNYTLNIDCNKLRENGKDEIINIFQSQVTDTMFNDFYSKKVCSGYECLKVLQNMQNPLDLISRDFNVFMKSQVKILIALAVLFGLLVLILARGIVEKLSTIGGSLITAGLPYFLIKALGSGLGSFIPPEASAVIPIIQQLFAPIAQIFLWVLISGVVLWAIALGIRMYQKYKTPEKSHEKAHGKKGKKK